MNQPAVRLLRVGDLPKAERTSDAVFLEADARDRRVSEPEPEPRSEAGTKKWIDRMRYFLEVDPEGCWVATDGDEIVGFAISQNRGRVWYLATYGVLPSHQGQGIGKRLIDATLAHAGDRAGLFSSTVHPGATRRYRLAGFSLYPQMRMVGTVDRATLPAITGLHEGSESDFGWMDELDEQRRGAGHGPDHRYLLDNNRLVVCGTRGYVYVDGSGRPALLAAADQETAEKLLWESLASSSGETLVNCITTANEWAVDVGLAARLDIGQEGYLALRGMPEPAPYLAGGQFL
ncbi:GNAT family N-acetyltransferase [Amycolatopsis sp. NPDC004625]|uniref:GNAT family N-acetyltransferase n=1 Tax=Amycolatopsis sp. NPDC004625 TaxID=3154670 RepID=UPI00339EB3BD